MVKTKVHTWKCKDCDKIIESIYEKQFEFNKKIHLDTCTKRILKEESKNDKKK